MQRTTIEWTETTWNPMTGCTKISVGCRNCYAERMANRLSAMGANGYNNGFDVTLHPHRLDEPSKCRRPRRVFVCSMGDLFHDDVPDHYIMRVFAAMASAPHHLHQVLTKRTLRLATLANRLTWEDNVWIGVTIEHLSYMRRIQHLLEVPANYRFLSLEPLLSAMPGLDLRGIRWVIVGGESGPNARPMDPDWVREIRDQCVSQNVPFFFKQWGGKHKKRAGSVLDGREWKQMPAITF